MRLHIAVLATLIPDASKFLPLPKLLALFTPRQPHPLYRGIEERHVTALIRHRLRRPWRMRGRRCLRQGLLCFYFLRLIDVPAVLRFGVFAEEGPHEVAHCWITVHDRCVTEPPQHAYIPIMTHPADGSGGSLDGTRNLCPVSCAVGDELVPPHA